VFQNDPNSKLSPRNISAEEHRLVLEAENVYGRFYKNAVDMYLLLFNFLDSVKSEGWVFISFLSQVHKHIMLSILSTVRHHNAQALLDLRQVFEAGVLAAYATHEKSENAYYTIDAVSDKLNIIDSVRGKAYKWLESSYAKHSETLKRQKEIINDLYAHSSMFLTHYNLSVEDPREYKSLLFDRDTINQTKCNLWLIANTCWLFLDLYGHVIAETKIAQLNQDFMQKLTELGQENDALKKEQQKSKK